MTHSPGNPESVSSPARVNPSVACLPITLLTPSLSLTARQFEFQFKFVGRVHIDDRRKRVDWRPRGRNAARRRRNRIAHRTLVPRGTQYDPQPRQPRVSIKPRAGKSERGLLADHAPHALAVAHRQFRMDRAAAHRLGRDIDNEFARLVRRRGGGHLEEAARRQLHRIRPAIALLPLPDLADPCALLFAHLGFGLSQLELDQIARLLFLQRTGLHGTARHLGPREVLPRLGRRLLLTLAPGFLLARRHCPPPDSRFCWSARESSEACPLWPAPAGSGFRKHSGTAAVSRSSRPRRSCTPHTPPLQTQW